MGVGDGYPNPMDLDGFVKQFGEAAALQAQSEFAIHSCVVQCDGICAKIEAMQGTFFNQSTRKHW